MKKYNIILILVLIILLLIVFVSSATSSYSYYNLSSQKIIEGADTLGTTFLCLKNKKILKDPITLEKNWGLTFTVNVSQPCSSDWQQVIGLTPNLTTAGSGADARFFGAWLYPNSSKLHLRIATTDEENAEITNNEPELSLNTEYRVDVISNRTSDKKQLIDVTITNMKTGAIFWTKHKTFNPPRYSGETNNSVYVFTTYDSYDPIHGYLKDVVFITDPTKNIIGPNLDHAIRELNANANSKNSPSPSTVAHFTTMQDAAITEGYTDISNAGSMGNNGYITGLAPPTNPKGVKPGKNYTPIEIDGNPICATSTVRTSDLSYNYIRNYDFNYPLAFNTDGTVKKSVPICSPDELYTIQKVLLDKLNSFNHDYINFVTDKYNKVQHGATGDGTAKLQYVPQSTEGSYSNVDNVAALATYKALKSHIDTFNDLLVANKAYYPDPDQGSKTGLSSMDPIILDENHRNMVKLRSDLDKKLFELNNTQNTVAGERKMQMDSSIYVTILWTTLATSIIYFMLI